MPLTFSYYNIVIQNIHKYFGGFKAVDGTSLEIKKNSITGLIGPNGVAKQHSLMLLLEYISLRAVKCF